MQTQMDYYAGWKGNHPINMFKRLDGQIGQAAANKLSVMPQLKHSFLGHNYDVCKSQVVGWMTAQPEILQALFVEAKRSGLIWHSSSAFAWMGINNPATPPQIRSMKHRA